MKELVLLLLTGFTAAAINAVSGGAKLLVLPVLIGVGLSSLTANITASLVLLPGAVAAAWVYRHELARIPRRLFLLLIPCYIGALVGTIALGHTSKAAFDELIPWLILAAVLLFAIQPFLHRHVPNPFRKHPRLTFPAIALLMLIVAVYGGYFGGGFGLAFMALLGLTTLTNIYQLSALKNVAAAGMEVLGMVYFSVAGGIAWKVGLPAMLAGIFGGIFGARYALKLSPGFVRGTVILIGIALTVWTFMRAYS